MKKTVCVFAANKSGANTVDEKKVEFCTQTEWVRKERKKHAKSIYRKLKHKINDYCSLIIEKKEQKRERERACVDRKTGLKK